MNNIWQPMNENLTSEYDVLYCRLSRDDGEEKESNSISNQKSILLEFTAKNGFDHPVFVGTTDTPARTSKDPVGKPFLRKLNRAMSAQLSAKIKTVSGVTTSVSGYIWRCSANEIYVLSPFLMVWIISMRMTILHRLETL